MDFSHKKLFHKTYICTFLLCNLKSRVNRFPLFVFVCRKNYNTKEGLIFDLKNPVKKIVVTTNSLTGIT